MKLEEEIFKKSIIDFNKLEKYGFNKDQTNYTYTHNILNNKFKVLITIDEKSHITSKIYDLKTNEEYLNYRIKAMQGDFVNKVRTEYLTLLEDIKKHCCLNKYFVFKQSNMLADYLIKTYNNYPEFPWASNSDYGLFRNQKNKKWYALIMSIDKSKLCSKTGNIEIVNIKINPQQREEILAIKGIYPAYHMNKKYWVSIFLDGSLSDQKLLQLVTASYDLVAQLK